MAEAAGLAVGVVSLISLAATCADAYRLHTAVREFHSDGSTLLMKIDIERARFYLCLQGLGIVEEEINGQLQSEPGMMQLVMRILYQIQGTLKEASDITDKYYLPHEKDTLSSRDHEGRTNKESKVHAAPPPITSLPRGFWERHGLPTEENLWQQYEEPKTERSLSYRRRLKWAIIDKSRLSNLIENLRIYNDSLAKVLPQMQTVTTERLPSVILPRVSQEEAIASIGNAAASTYPTLSQAAKFMEVISKSAVSVQSPDAPDNKWRIKDGPIFALSQQFSCYYTGEYCGTRVVVEKKTIIHEPRSISFCLAQRADSLAQLLGEKTKPTGFRVLNCLGYEIMSDSYWFISEFPSGSDTNTPPMNLARLISKSKSPSETGIPCPSASERLQLAYQAALSLLQLHAVHWLHKDVRPDNFLFFVKEGSRNYDVTRPWLAGFSYSRPFGAYISTDVNRRDMTDLYLAPAYKQVAGSLTRYQKRYDIYSLGLVLFEIGLWDRLENRVSITCKDCHLPERSIAFHRPIMKPGLGCKFDVAYRFAKDNLHLLDNFGPKAYTVVVEKCLAGLRASTSADSKFDPIGGWREWDDNADEVGELERKFTLEVVQELEKLLPETAHRSIC